MGARVAVCLVVALMLAACTPGDVMDALTDRADVDDESVPVVIATPIPVVTGDGLVARSRRTVDLDAAEQAAAVATLFSLTDARICIDGVTGECGDGNGSTVVCGGPMAGSSADELTYAFTYEGRVLSRGEMMVDPTAIGGDTVDVAFTVAPSVLPAGEYGCVLRDTGGTFESTATIDRGPTGPVYDLRICDARLAAAERDGGSRRCTATPAEIEGASELVCSGVVVQPDQGFGLEVVWTAMDGSREQTLGYRFDGDPSISVLSIGFTPADFGLADQTFSPGSYTCHFLPEPGGERVASARLLVC